MVMTLHFIRANLCLPVGVTSVTTHMLQVLRQREADNGVEHGRPLLAIVTFAAIAGVGRVVADLMTSRTYAVDLIHRFVQVVAIHLVVTEPAVLVLMALDAIEFE